LQLIYLIFSIDNAFRALTYINDIQKMKSAMNEKRISLFAVYGAMRESFRLRYDLTREEEKLQ
jgi:hypothetical protein